MSRLTSTSPYFRVIISCLYWFIVLFTTAFIINQIFNYFIHNESKMYTLFFNSDSLFIPDFVQNLLYQNGQLANWALPGVTYFFPDIVLSMIISLFSNHIQLNITLYAIIQITLFLFTISLVFKNINHKASTYRLGLLSGLIALLGLSKGYLSDHELLNTLVISNFHISQVIVAYACLYLLLGYLNAPRFYLLIILFMLIIVMIPSDLIFMASFCAPAMMSILIFTLSGYIRWQGGAKIILFILIATFMGYLFFIYSPLPYIDVYEGFWKLFIENLHAFQIVLNNLCFRAHWFYRNYTFIAWLWIIFTPSALFSIFYTHKIALASAKEQRQIQFALIFVLCNLIAGLLAISFNDQLYAPTTFIGFRHMQSIIITPLFIGIPLLLYRHLHLLHKLLTNTILYSIVLLCLPLNYIGNDVAPSFSSMINYYPSPLQCVDHVEKKFNLHAGIATYWQFRPFSLLGHHHVPIVEVNEYLFPKHWMNTLQFYHQNNFDFALLRPEMTRKDQHIARILIKRYGKPNHQVICPNHFLVYVYDKHQLNDVFSGIDLNQLKIKNHY